ncbi:hypothetical protein EON63_10870 [archaeon]|nr:MAG: hypothetical protein EON63_10870 [archaeon]
MSSIKQDEDFLTRLRVQLEGQRVVKVEHDNDDIVIFLNSQDKPAMVVLYIRPEVSKAFEVHIDGNKTDISEMVSILESTVGSEDKLVLLESIREFTCECIDEESNLHGGLLFDLTVMEAESLPETRKGTLICMYSPSSRILLKDVDEMNK